VYSLILSVENFRPGAMEKLGIGYETLVEANPTIILASVSGTVPVHPWQFRLLDTDACQDTDPQAPSQNEQGTT
jgi:hypothetical protein